jgi:hypothetical protein
MPFLKKFWEYDSYFHLVMQFGTTGLFPLIYLGYSFDQYSKYIFDRYNK